MAAFLYFIPGAQAGLDPDDLKAAGLGYALGPETRQQHTTSGPGGKGGLVIADASHCEAARTRYVPAEQEWTRLTATPQACAAVESFLHVGRWKSDVIGPGQLARDRLLEGHFLTLADGRRWLCPMARAHAIDGGAVRFRHTLPRSVTFGPDRRWQPGQVVPAYRRLWDLATAWWDARVAAARELDAADETIRFDFDGAFSAAAECLAANYRLGPTEISLLNLFDSDSARKILDALVDLPSVLALTDELQKKTAEQASHPVAG